MASCKPPIPLTQAQTGCDLEIAGFCPAACSALRLAELGLCPGRIVRVLFGQDPVICEVADGRVGLSRQLAGEILVRARASTTAVLGGSGMESFDSPQ